jgi:hypothetical protein
VTFLSYANDKFDWSKADKSHVGTYIIEVFARIKMAPQINSGVKTITLNIKMCDAPTISTNKSSENVVYFISVGNPSPDSTTMPTYTISPSNMVAVCKLTWTESTLPAIPVSPTPTPIAYSIGYDTGTPKKAIKVNFKVGTTNAIITA